MGCFAAMGWEVLVGAEVRIGGGELIGLGDGLGEVVEGVEGMGLVGVLRELGLQPEPIYGPEYNDNARLNVFASNLEDTLVKYGVKNLETMDLIFIPVLLSQHFFCICFHLKKGDIELIDNSRIKQAFGELYCGHPEMLVKLQISSLHTIIIRY
ncbi:hypothetical protein Hanom_Chr04g00321121 [Helianthus anomalus]